MKRGLLIAVGVVLIVALVAVWVYILFFSESGSENDGVFANLDFGEDTEVVPDNQVENDVVVEVFDENQILRQLTTGPVVGFTEVINSLTSNPSVYYVSPGTGHITSIDLVTGEEKRVSGTTIPATSNAVLDRNGEFVLFQYGFGAQSKTLVGSINSVLEELEDQNELGDNLISVAMIGDVFVFGERDGGSVVAKQYNPATKVTKQLFTIPFTEVVISWGNSLNGKHYVYPKANSSFEGYLYEVSGGVMSRLPISGYGLTALGNNDSIVYSYVKGGIYRSEVYSQDTDSSRYNIVDLLPEKCLFVENQNFFVCGIDSDTKLTASTPNRWYQGLESYSDDFWLFNPSFTTGNFVLDVENESGRKLDIINLSSSKDGGEVYFQNKTNGTLWMYEIIPEFE